MAETLINTAESGGIPPSNGSFFHRRIEFLPAKKPFTGFSNGSGGFRLETLNPTTSASLRPCSSGQGSGRPTTMGKRSDSLDATEFGLDPELSFGITLRRIGAGLENLGNTCFLNSVLQCLTYTEPLAAYLQSGKHKNSCRKAGFCALCAIQNHVSRALQSTGRSLAPKDLVSNLRCISRNFRNARQEDAHEYMVNLLESMHKCCLPAGVPSESPSAFERSLVHKIFGGRLRSQVKCMQCSFCSDKFDPFLDLSLEINKADSLQKALAHFTAKEYLDGGAREYHCQRCKQKVKALKQLSIHKAPYVLNIHLKRFGSYQPGQKIDRKVQFGLTLDLKPFVTGAYDGDLRYTLYGVLVHYGGNTHSGHYYCFVRTSSGMWYSLDDHKVRHVSEKMVLEEKAYMLFYVRDRKDFVPKKPVDVVHAKSMIINAMGSRIPSDFNQGSKITVQNGLADKRVESLSPSAALTQLDIAVADTLKENVFKETSVKVNGQGTVAKSSSLKKDAQLGTSSKMPVLKDAVKGLSPLPPNGGECLAQSVVTNGSSGGLHNTVFVTTGKEINECNMERSTKENRSEVVEAPDSSYHHKSVANTPKYNEDKAEKDMSDSFAMKSECNGFHSSAGDSFVIDGISLKDSDEKESKKINPSSKVEQPRHKNTQIGGLLKESTDGDSGKKMEAIELSKLSGLESTRVLMHQKAPDRSQRKMKKKFLKTHITRTRLSSGILLGAALGLRKKQHKNIKRPPVKIDNLTQEHLLVRKPFPTDLGPSTSEITRALSVCGTVNSQGKASKSSSSKKDDISIAKNEKGSNCHLVEGVADETLRGRVGQNDAVLASDKPPQLRSSLLMAVNGSVGGEANTLKESSRDSVQNGLMNMLTRGLEETIVARWDGVEHPSSQITETSGVEPVSIGYIGDDWDEEYDKGKRKKLRSSNIDFGGPNPFQEIATQKAKFKKAKIDRSSSANQPFRIRGQCI